MLFGSKKRPSCTAFVDFEHWYISYTKHFNIKPNIKEWYNSMKEADEIIVLDTGSTDETLQIIEEYAETASPVGSVMMAKLFGVSPATIRAEMARLEGLGLIAQPHTSAGRVPTDAGYRFYVNSLEDDKENVYLHIFNNKILVVEL